MARIASLYKMEAECADMVGSEWCVAREQRSGPIIDGIFGRLE
jgi:hypothetical protein